MGESSLAGFIVPCPCIVKNTEIMRFASILFLSFVLFSCSGSRVTAGRPGNINGTWVPVKEELGGTSLPSAAFQKQKLTISDSTYTMVAESVDKGIFRVSDDRIDIYGKEGVNKGRHIMAIYQMKNDELTICYNMAGTRYPVSFET